MLDVIKNVVVFRILNSSCYKLLDEFFILLLDYYLVTLVKTNGHTLEVMAEV
jgi:hypothetical protein